MCASRLHTFFPDGNWRHRTKSTFLDLRCFEFEVLISITPLSLLNKQSWETRTVAKYSWRHSHLATEGRTSSGHTAMILWWLITWWMLLQKQIKPYQLEILLPFPYVSNLGKSKVYPKKTSDFSGSSPILSPSYDAGTFRPTPTGGGQEIQEPAHGMGHLGVSSMIRFVKGR